MKKRGVGRRRISAGNLFQTIKGWQTEAEAQGIKLVRLSIGQPDGAAPLLARVAAAHAVMFEETSMHEYQDNGEIGTPGFAREFVNLNLVYAGSYNAVPIKEFEALPIPGIKPILTYVVLACQATFGERIVVMTNTGPGYPTPKMACNFLGMGDLQSDLIITPENKFLPQVVDLEKNEPPDLIMLNYPHNPTGQVMDLETLWSLCTYCQTNGVRLFNDGAYTCLDYSGKHVPLALIAQHFPKLSWMEAYSASKLGNMTGWRIGAVTGSDDFISDFKDNVKGELDSGHVAFAAAGVQRLCQTDTGYIDRVRTVYKKRLKKLCDILSACSMVLAVPPSSGFFAFFRIPKKAFGEEIGDAEEFNKLMIKNTGVVGVHFGKYIRYSVSTCTFTDEDCRLIQEGFEKANVSY